MHMQQEHTRTGAESDVSDLSGGARAWLRENTPGHAGSNCGQSQPSCQHKGEHVQDKAQGTGVKQSEVQ